MKRYEHHENFEDDPKYINYLDKIVQATVPHLASGMTGLDFGSGKSQLLEILFEKLGFKMNSFDLYFRPEQKIFQNSYDFIILSEVIEHLREPGETMNQLRSMLNKKGALVVKTKVRPAEQDKFHDWFYKRDLTHVQFFDTDSFAWMAQKLGLKPPELIGNDLYIFKE